MSARTITVALWACLALAGGAWAQDSALPLVVIVNAKSPIGSLSGKEVADLYLGRVRSLGDVKQVIALDQPIASPLRTRFYRDVTGKEIGEINAYWARLLFSGQSSPPLAMPDTATVLDMVRQNPTAVGYLDYVPADKAVRVVFTLTSKR